MRFLLALCCIVLLGAASPLPSGFLQTSGSQITDGSGNNVRLACAEYTTVIGSNPFSTVFSQEFGGGNTTAATDLAALRAAGFNCIRYGWYDVGLSLATLDTIVSLANTNNLKVIFEHLGNENNSSCKLQQKNGVWYDLNTAAPNNTTNNTDGCGTAGTINYATFKANWTSIATHYSGNTNVIGFDLHSAPVVAGIGLTTPVNWGGANGSDMLAMCSDVGHAVNLADPGPLVVCEGPINAGTLFSQANQIGVQADKAVNFLDMFGVNTHFNDSSGIYANGTFSFTTSMGKITAAGIHHIRDYYVDAGGDGAVSAILAAGIKSDGIALLNNQDCSIAINQALHAKSVLGANLESLEIGNEINGGAWNSCAAAFSGTTQDSGSGAEGVKAGQLVTNVCNAVHANPTLAGVLCVDTSVADFGQSSYNSYITNEGNLTNIVDAGVVHNYPIFNDVAGGGEPFGTRQTIVNVMRNVTHLPKPIWVTETGAQTFPGCSGQCISNLGMAKTGPNNFLDHWLLTGPPAGAPSTRMFWYELYDNPPSGGIYGLYDNTGTAKPIVAALHNMTTIVADAGNQSFTAGKLNYALTGGDSTTHSFLLQGSDGTFSVMVWNEAKIYDDASKTDVTPAAVPVTVNFGRQTVRADVYLPRTSTASIANCLSCSSIVVQLQGEPQIVRLK